MRCTDPWKRGAEDQVQKASGVFPGEPQLCEYVCRQVLHCRQLQIEWDLEPLTGDRC